MGIIGFGAIGRRVAEIAKCFGMNILVYDRSPWKEEEKRKAEELGAKFVDSLEELMSKADIVSIHVPLTPETRHMIRMEQLKLLKPGAIIVNVARGAVIDGKTLIEFLKERKDVVACLDVYTVEPPTPGQQAEEARECGLGTPRGLLHERSTREKSEDNLREHQGTHRRETSKHGNMDENTRPSPTLPAKARLPSLDEFENPTKADTGQD